MPGRMSHKSLLTETWGLRFRAGSASPNSSALLVGATLELVFSEKHKYLKLLEYALAIRR